MIRSALLLALVAVIGTAMLAGVHTLTKDRIAAQQRRVVLQQLNQVLPAGSYNNSLHDDLIEVHEPVFFRHKDAIKIYRARQDGIPVAVVMNLVAPDGYNGDIRMLVAIRTDGQISGVRIISHRETPGLGDPIERKRSDWVLGFDGRSLQDPSVDAWAVRRDGGEFEQFTGATITPRAVVETVQRALEYFSAQQDILFQGGTASADHEPLD